MTHHRPTPRPAQEVGFPELIRTEAELVEALTRPSATLVEFVRTLSSPLLILGAGGKIGPTLAGQARRAADAAGHPLDIIAVSRFGDAEVRRQLEHQGVRTMACDLLEAEAARRLPEAEQVIYLVGLKAGTRRNPSATWAINTLVPTHVCERYPQSRLVALSTGNVYPLTEVSRGGAVETDPLTPLGEYANAAVGRERLFEYHSRRHHTPVALIRLCYAVELRYGVLVDLARKILNHEAISLTTGYFNCIWQGDAQELILRALPLAASPPTVWNMCGPDVLAVREIATRLGALLGRSPRFVGEESPTALLANASPLCTALGPPPTPLEVVLRWTAHWVQQGGRNLGKPTQFEVRDGNY